MKREDNPQEWLRYAENDRRAATHLYEAALYEQAAFHCQQAVEKLLKAIIVQQTQQRPPHTHDLRRLLELITNLAVDEELAAHISAVSSLYIATRYPLDVIDPNTLLAPVAARAEQSTEVIFKWFLTRVNFASE